MRGNMKDNILTNLNKLENIKNNLLVESIYIMPINDTNKIAINIILNKTPQYNLTTYKEKVPNFEEEYKLLAQSIDEIKLKYPNFLFTISDSVNYGLDFENDSSDLLLAKKILDSYIIFDRYGYYKQLQEKLNDKLTSVKTSYVKRK